MRIEWFGRLCACGGPREISRSEYLQAALRSVTVWTLVRSLPASSSSTSDSQVTSFTHRLHSVVEAVAC